MAIWFGKGCDFQINMWEENEMTGGPDFKENTPTLIYCSHIGNSEDSEGNCRKDNCPLKKEDEEDGKKVCS